MKRPLRSLLRIALLFVLCVSSISLLYGASMVSGLTGSFGGPASSPLVTGGYTGDMSACCASYSTGVYIGFDWLGDYTDYSTSTYPCDDGITICWVGFSGTGLAGSLSGDLFDQSGNTILHFAGIVSDGNTSGIECIAYECDGPRGSGSAFVVFSGQWDNGMYSYGTIDLNDPGLGYGAYGSADITTYAPEPSAIVLLGSSILGAAGILRRKFRK